VGFKARKKPIPKLSPDQLAEFWGQKSASHKKRFALTAEEIAKLSGPPKP
jgi:hypothetical protein